MIRLIFIRSKLGIKNYIYVLLMVLTFGCKTPYRPVDGSLPTNYLVVEGVINSSANDSTVIKLSRTVRLSSNFINNTPEANAEVWVEDGQGFTIKLKELSKGNYITGALGLSNTKQYRLRIKTTENKTYLSDMLAVIHTPPIDTVGFYLKDAGVQVYINTHDPTKNTRYYRWEFVEDWKFHTAFESDYITNGIEIVKRIPEQNFAKYCWGSAASNNIVVGSSVKLSQDVIYLQPLIHIDNASDKIMDRYRIQVKQYALTKEAFTFWEELKRNTESLGSIFDIQPSANKSNIHCGDNIAEPVVGYITISNVQTKTVYFSKFDLLIPTVAASILSCKLDSQYFCHPQPIPPCFGNDVERYLIPLYSALIPQRPFWLGPYLPETPPTGYLATTQACLDCSIRGSKTPPLLWKE